jgi:hypothetical protein
MSSSWAEVPLLAPFLHLIGQTRERAPAFVHLLCAFVRACVEVCPANGAESGAFRLAKRLGRLRHEDILPQAFSQIQIKALADAKDFAVGVVDLHWGSSVGVGHRHVLLLEVDVKGDSRFLETAHAMGVDQSVGIHFDEQSAIRPEQSHDAFEVVHGVSLDAEFRFQDVELIDGTDGLAELAEDVDGEHGDNW